MIYPNLPYIILPISENASDKEKAEKMNEIIMQLNKLMICATVSPDRIHLYAEHLRKKV